MTHCGGEFLDWYVAMYYRTVHFQETNATYTIINVSKHRSTEFLLH